MAAVTPALMVPDEAAALANETVKTKVIHPFTHPTILLTTACVKYSHLCVEYYCSRRGCHCAVVECKCSWG